MLKRDDEVLVWVAEVANMSLHSITRQVASTILHPSLIDMAKSPTTAEFWWMVLLMKLNVSAKVLNQNRERTKTSLSLSNHLCVYDSPRAAWQRELMNLAAFCECAQCESKKEGSLTNVRRSKVSLKFVLPRCSCV